MGPTTRRRPSASVKKTDDPVQMYLSIIYTLAVNLSGVARHVDSRRFLLTDVPVEFATDRQLFQ